MFELIIIWSWDNEEVPPKNLEARPVNRRRLYDDKKIAWEDLDYLQFHSSEGSIRWAGIREIYKIENGIGYSRKEKHI